MNPPQYTEPNVEQHYQHGGSFSSMVQHPGMPIYNSSIASTALPPAGSDLPKGKRSWYSFGRRDKPGSAKSAAEAPQLSGVYRPLTSQTFSQQDPHAAVPSLHSSMPVVLLQPQHTASRPLACPPPLSPPTSSPPSYTFVSSPTKSIQSVPHQHAQPEVSGVTSMYAGTNGSGQSLQSSSPSFTHGPVPIAPGMVMVAAPPAQSLTTTMQGLDPAEQSASLGDRITRERRTTRAEVDDIDTEVSLSGVTNLSRSWWGAAADTVVTGASFLLGEKYQKPLIAAYSAGKLAYSAWSAVADTDNDFFDEDEDEDDDEETADEGLKDRVMNALQLSSAASLIPLLLSAAVTGAGSYFFGVDPFSPSSLATRAVTSEFMRQWLLHQLGEAD